MRVLAIDTALGQCAACILDTEEAVPVAAESIAMERGHAESLLPLLDRLVSGVEGGFGAVEHGRSENFDAPRLRRGEPRAGVGGAVGFGGAA